MMQISHQNLVHCTHSMTENLVENILVIIIMCPFTKIVNIIALEHLELYGIMLCRLSQLQYPALTLENQREALKLMSS